MQPHDPKTGSNDSNGSPHVQAVVEELDRSSHDEHSRVPVHSSPGTGRRLAIAVILLACVLAAAFAIRHHSNSTHASIIAEGTTESADAPAAVDVVKVAYASASHDLPLPGETSAWYASVIYARVNGYVHKWYTDIGTHVNEGQVLADIDTPDLDAQLAAAKAKLNAGERDVEVARSNSDFAAIQNQRWATAKSGTVAIQEQQEKDAEYKASLAKLAASQAQRDLDKSDVDRLEAFSAFKKVRAPYEGTITERQIDIGDLVTAGSTANTTSLFKLSQTETIRVFVDVPQAVASEVRDGMQAAATAREFPGRTFTGTVARNSHAIDVAAKTLKVEVDIPNPDGALLPGMYVQVRFRTVQSHPLLRVPAAAMNFRTGGPQVAVVSSDAIVKFRDVTIGRDLGDYVEIASGLQTGDRVALNISNQVADGDKVAATEVDLPGANPNPLKSTTTVAEGRPNSQ